MGQQLYRYDGHLLAGLQKRGRWGLGPERLPMGVDPKSVERARHAEGAVHAQRPHATAVPRLVAKGVRPQPPASGLDLETQSKGHSTGDLDSDLAL